MNPHTGHIVADFPTFLDTLRKENPKAVVDATNTYKPVPKELEPEVERVLAGQAEAHVDPQDDRTPIGKWMAQQRAETAQGRDRARAKRKARNRLARQSRKANR